MHVTNENCISKCAKMRWTVQECTKPYGDGVESDKRETTQRNIRTRKMILFFVCWSKNIIVIILAWKHSNEGSNLRYVSLLITLFSTNIYFKIKNATKAVGSTTSRESIIITPTSYSVFISGYRLKKNKASFEYVRHSDYLIFALLNQVSWWCTVGPLQINPVNNSKGLTKQLLIFVNGDGKSAGTRKHNWVLLPNIHSQRSMQKVYYKIALTRIIFLVVSRRESNIELVISGIFDIARERAIEWVSEQEKERFGRFDVLDCFRWCCFHSVQNRYSQSTIESLKAATQK